MNLKILLPFRIFVELSNIVRVVLDTTEGSYGFLPLRRDCVAALTPGILTYENRDGRLFYVAIDEGILIKTEEDIQVSVRNAIAGPDLGKLHESIEKKFKDIDKSERSVRKAVAKLESEFIQTIKKLHQ